MKMVSWFSAILLGLIKSLTVSAADIKKGDSPLNFILVTLDGVRWQEVFQGTDPQHTNGERVPIFKSLWNSLVQEGFIYGDKSKGAEATTANRSIASLPAYQSIMAGSTQPCNSNACGRIKVQTVQERLVEDLGFRKMDVATIGSWNGIEKSVEHVPQATFVNIGEDTLVDGEMDSELEQINAEQKKESPPWSNARYDKYTFAHALRYLKVHKPRFLFIALNDSDEWGHKSEYKKYVATLRQYDEWLKTLVAELDKMGDYGKNTVLVVTTDHGRDNGKDWGEHGSGYPDSASIWIYGRSPFTRSHPKAPLTKTTYSHLDIRPTIEAMFGLKPKDPSDSQKGRVIVEITGPIKN